MGSISILFTNNAVKRKKYQQSQELNTGLLGRKQECFLCAKQPLMSSDQISLLGITICKNLLVLQKLFVRLSKAFQNFFPTSIFHKNVSPSHQSILDRRFKNFRFESCHFLPLLFLLLFSSRSIRPKLRRPVSSAKSFLGLLWNI